MKPRLIGICIALLCIALISGCAVGIDSTIRECGKKIGNTTLQQIAPGETTKDWVEMTLGQPSSKNKLNDGTEIYKYEYSKTVQKETFMIFIFGSDTETKTSQVVYIEIKDNIVKKYWTETD
jgi:outer membrane protein assembly factor BamE (lipoprotein component of BamABCDE complex)